MPGLGLKQQEGQAFSLPAKEFLVFWPSCTQSQPLSSRPPPPPSFSFQALGCPRTSRPKVGSGIEGFLGHSPAWAGLGVAG